MKKSLLAFSLKTIVLLCIGLWATTGALLAIDISDVPLETTVYTPPGNLMMVLDNSGSMDWEFMTAESEGLWQDCYYLFPESAYHPVADHRYGVGHSLTPLQACMWRGQWAGYNRIYFDPYKAYQPWPSTQRYVFSAADLNRPWSNPMRTGGGHARIDLTAPFFSVRSGVEVICIANAHYFTLDDANGNGLRDPGEAIYLITWIDEDSDGALDVSGQPDVDRRRFYRFVDDGDDLVEDNELVAVVDESEKDRVRPAVVNADGRFIRHQTDREALQNFANWCTYYRRRLFTLKATVATLISGLKQIHIGLCAVNGGPRLGVQPVGVVTGDSIQDGTPALLNALYGMHSEGLTPLRSALDRVGRYFGREGRAGFDQSFPSLESGAPCQRQMALVVSDGFWNGTFSGVGNADGDNGAPYADDYADTLADVAAHYYENDLASGVEDAMPAAGCDDAPHQHLVTLTLSFGLNGTINIGDMDRNGVPDRPGYKEDPCFNSAGTAMPAWPQPIGIAAHEAGRGPAVGSSSAELLDDLWHAAINGHGGYYAMGEIPALQKHISTTMPQTEGETTATASTIYPDPSTNGFTLYRATYDPRQWRGDVTAWANDESSTGGDGRLLWRAADQFQQPGLDWDTRSIVTYGGTAIPPTGVPFRYDSLSQAQQITLNTDVDTSVDTRQSAMDLIAWLRGAQLSQFRTRTSQMGDVVHSAPVVVGNTLFVGANDGMLHAFDAQTGQERFAYVPNLVMDHLKALSEPVYPSRHRFYVDGPLWAGEVVVGTFQRRTYLVGGLGKGGRGYFCLLAGTRHRSWNGQGYGDYEWAFHVDQLGAQSNEGQVCQAVQWEYPRPDPANDHMDNNGDGSVDEQGEYDPDMGYTFGQAYAVNANSVGETHRPVVIFANGYDSPSQSALLYVLSAATGEIVRKIDTGAVGDNGLSTPALIDVNRDNRVDYAYAGDFKGNLWKFDLSADDPMFWGVAYGQDRNDDGIIDAAHGDAPQPLFQTPGQPITGRPDVMAMANACNPETSGYMVIFGTGRYLAVGDHSDIRQQSLYGIWDYGDDSDDSEYLGFMVDRSNGRLSNGLRLVRQTVTDETTLDDVIARQISQRPVDYGPVEDPTDGDGGNDAHQAPDPAQDAGWFLDFPSGLDPLANPGERVVGRVTLRGGKAVVISLVPEQRLCRSGGASWLYILNGCDGSPPRTQTGENIGARRMGNPIHADPVIIKDPGRPNLDQILAPDLSGRVIKEVFAGEPWGKAYWWQNID